MIKIKNEDEKHIKFKCEWCKGVTQVKLIKNINKSTFPEIEYCPICGMSDEMIKSTKVKAD